MITNERASFIAHRWIEAWNRKDIEMVLRNYTQTIRYTAPRAIFYTGTESTTIVGKRNLREFFSRGMSASLEGRYQIQDITMGVDSISIIYKIDCQKTAVEVMFINDKGKVYKSYAFRN